MPDDKCLITPTIGITICGEKLYGYMTKGSRAARVLDISNLQITCTGRCIYRLRQAACCHRRCVFYIHSYFNKKQQMTLILIISIVASLAIGGVVAIAISRHIDKAKGKGIIDEAKLEAEMIKKNKIIEAKEAEMAIKSEAEKTANARLAKVQTAEAKLKQREMQMNQQQSELQRKKNEVDAMKGNLENQLALVDSKQAELDKMHRNIQETLEHVSGLSAEEAKEKLVESLKDEAKTAAAAYINDIMDDAKMTANKEAKRNGNRKCRDSVPHRQRRNQGTHHRA